MDNQQYKEKKSRPMGLNMGSSLIIMLFAVLCLTVLAALSLLSASSQMRLAERSANVVSKYYDADFIAAGIYERVLQGDETALYEADSMERQTVIGGMDTEIITFTVDVDDRQALEVKYTVRGGAHTLESWKLVEAGLWMPDDGLNLWVGD